MTAKRIRMGAIPDQNELLLFVDWLQVLINEQVGVQSHGSSGNNWEIRLRDDSVCKISLDQGSVFVDFPERIAEIAEHIAIEASKRMKARDFGEPVWWVTGLNSRSVWNEVSQLHMMRNLSEHKRFQGPWRFSNDVLLQFTQADPGPTFAFVAKQDVKIIFRTHGPCNGFLSKGTAEWWTPRLRAVVAFASAAPHDGGWAVLPADDQERNEAKALLEGATLGELFVEDVQLGPQLGWLLHASQDHEAFDRVINAMLAYEYALEQKSDPAALVFLVTAIEALSVPNASWQRERIAKRFREFLLLACPEAVNQIMQHANFVEAFGRIKNPKEFIDTLYSLRSRPVHTGQLAGASGFLGLAQPGAMRVALASELARAAIIAFLRRPISLLWGHPELDPSVQLKLTFEEHVLLQEQAKRAKKKAIADWIRLVVLNTARQAPKTNDDVKTTGESSPRNSHGRRREKRRQKRGKR